MAANDSWEFRVTTYGQGQLGLCVLHAIEGVSLGTGATKQQIADQVSANWAGVLIPWMGPTFSYRGVEASIYSPPANVINPIVSVSGQGVGTGTGAAPTQTSGLISLRSALVGRRGQGRVFLPFPAASMVSSLGVPTTAALTQLALAAVFLAGPISAGSGGNTTALFYSVRSRKFSQAGTVSSAIVRPEFATQRRRGYFGRVNSQPF